MFVSTPDKTYFVARRSMAEIALQPLLTRIHQNIMWAIEQQQRLVRVINFWCHCGAVGWRYLFPIEIKSLAVAKTQPRGMWFWAPPPRTYRREVVNAAFYYPIDGGSVIKMGREIAWILTRWLHCDKVNFSPPVLPQQIRQVNWKIIFLIKSS